MHLRKIFVCTGILKLNWTKLNCSICNSANLAPTKSRLPRWNISSYIYGYYIQSIFKQKNSCLCFRVVLRCSCLPKTFTQFFAASIFKQDPTKIDYNWQHTFTKFVHLDQAIGRTHSLQSSPFLYTIHYLYIISWSRIINDENQIIETCKLTDPLAGLQAF